MRLSLSFALCLPASRRLANIKLRRSLRPGFFFITIPPNFLLPAPAPWPYIADFTRPEGLQRAALSGQRLSSFGTALQSCPALALQGKSPSLAVVSPYGAPMPHMSPLGHIVERCGESCHVCDLGAEVWVIRRSRAELHCAQVQHTG